MDAGPARPSPSTRPLVPADRLYVEQDADDNVTSLTNSAGFVVERYAYGPYGAVTVENPDGSVRGSGPTAGLAASSVYSFTVLYQGLRLDVATGTYDSHKRVYIVSLGRFGQPDPAGYVDGPDRYQFTLSNPVDHRDPTGLLSGWEIVGIAVVGVAVLVAAPIVVAALPEIVGGLAAGAATAAGADAAGAVAVGTFASAATTAALPYAGAVATGLALSSAANSAAELYNGKHCNGTPLTEDEEEFDELNLIFAGLGLTEALAGGLAESELSAPGGNPEPQTTCPEGQPNCFVAGTLVLTAPPPPAAAAGLFGGWLARHRDPCVVVGLGLAGVAGWYVLSGPERKRRRAAATTPPDGSDEPNPWGDAEPVWMPLVPAGWRSRRVALWEQRRVPHVRPQWAFEGLDARR